MNDSEKPLTKKRTGLPKQTTIAQPKGRPEPERKVVKVKKAKRDIDLEDEVIPVESLNDSDILILRRPLASTDMLRAEIKAIYGEQQSYKIYIQKYEHYKLAIENECNSATMISNHLVGLINAGFPGSEELAFKIMPRILTLRTGLMRTKGLETALMEGNMAVTASKKWSYGWRRALLERSSSKLMGGDLKGAEQDINMSVENLRDEDKNSAMLF